MQLRLHYHTMETAVDGIAIKTVKDDNMTETIIGMGCENTLQG